VSRYVIPMNNQTIIADSEMVIMRSATSFASRGSLNVIFRLKCSQQGTATSQQLGIRWGLKASAFGTYTATTPTPMVLGGVASALTGSTSNAASSAGTDSSSNGAGTLTVLDQQGFNNLNGFELIFTPEERIILGPDLTFVLQLQGTPTTLTGWNASVYYAELS
jgi:hypothetical protein